MPSSVRAPLAAVGLAALLAGATATTAAAKTTHFVEHERLAALETDAQFPAVGSSVLSAGDLQTTSFGGKGGAQINTVVVTGLPSPTTILFRTTGTDFFAAGTQRWRGTGTATLLPDGSVTSRGRGVYTGGTGRFRHARGRFTFTSSAMSATAVTFIDSTGTLRY